MSRNDAIVTVTDPHYVQDYPYEEKKKRVHIKATEIHDPRDPRKRPRLGRRQTTNTYGEKDEVDHQLTDIGQAFFKLLDNSIVRYAIYVLPVAACLAIPLILYAAVPSYKEKKIDGIRLVGLMVWLEIIWVSFWIAKLFAGAFPFVFQTVCGIFSTGIRKYSLVFRACETPVSLFIWSIMVYCFQPVIWAWSKHAHYVATHATPAHGKVKAVAAVGIPWLSIVHKLCTATIGVCALYLAEKLFVQMIAVNYHKRQFHDKIRNIKRTTLAIDRLYDASLRRYPDHHKDYSDFDYDIHDTNGVQKLGTKLGADRSTMRLIGDLGWISDKVTTAFGRLASDMTGREIKPTGNHAVVQQALERRYGAEALARRVFKALDKENDDAISEQDLIIELGPGAEDEARFIFDTLDTNKNGDVSLEEMISLVGSISHERKLMWRSAVDVREALKILDRALETVVLILILLIYAAFFSTYLATHYTQIWGSITGLSFMLGPTASELLSACILVFVKHPYDVGDRVDMSGFELVVTRISLLYTVFRRIDTDRAVQVPNSVINLLWVENVTRSSAMKERLTFSVSPGTSFDDIETLRRELEAFVMLPENRRDYYPEFDVELLSVGDLKQLDLRVEIRHKSNWSDESLRAYRRSKFMCALLSAMRKVPIAGPAGDGPIAGSLQNPNYGVSVPEEVAQAAKAQFDIEKDAKRLFPKNGSSVGNAVSSGLDLLPSLIARKTSTAGVDPFSGANANTNPFRVEVSIRLRRAVVNNDLALVQRILNTYPESVHNADRTEKSNNSLHVAAREGFYEIAEFIVNFAREQELLGKRASRGHSYQARKSAVGLTYNTDDQTPLHLAAARSHTRIAELLCQKFPKSIEKHDKEGRTPLHLASQAQATSTKPANPAFTSNARNLEDTSTLQVLLANHADVGAIDNVGSTCLHYATAWGNLKAVRVLVQAGADPLARNHQGWMPQYYSVTVQAEVYFRNLVAEWEKHQAEEEMRHRQRIEAERGGVRLVSDEDQGTEGTESDDGRDRADSGSSHFTMASEGDGLGIKVGRTDSWK